jgi:ribosomal protein S18 acetylase RimI-like enzyme
MAKIQLLSPTKDEFKLYMPQLLQLERESQLPILWDEPNFLKELDSKWQLSKFMLGADKLIGYAVVSKKNVSSCHLHRFIISSNLRGQGYGNSLLNHLKEDIEGNFDYLTLLVGKDNPAAIKFYSKNNFRQIWEIDENVLMVFKVGN